MAPLTAGTELACGSFSCDEAEASDRFSEAELDEPVYASRPASVLTDSRLRQFFDGRDLSFDSRFFLASFPLSPVRLSLPSSDSVRPTGAQSTSTTKLSYGKYLYACARPR